MSKIDKKREYDKFLQERMAVLPDENSREREIHQNQIGQKNDQKSAFEHFQDIGFEHFGRSVFKKVWGKSDWAEFESYYQNLERAYHEISNQLENQEKENFQFDFFDRLREQHGYQDRTKYKVYLDRLIQKLKAGSNAIVGEDRKEEKTSTSEPGLTTKEYLCKQENKLIPKVSIADVFNHFEILTKETNKKGFHYLTEKQLSIFIESTFIKKEPVKQHFNGTPNHKKDVRSVFFRFYENCAPKEYNKTHLKPKYFDILDKSFYGFNQTDYNDFHKINENIKA
ncbi:MULTISPECIES: hypothetical protein [Flavobacteriaceae]|uniref:hypothetical protein n=1 Tax=Flavobacteriaceae TaxID=49546 RepID=UPI0014910932|nr:MULTISPECIES: hypothetical protein [Allomuricauda]MDC6366924.1 hypothetical protein [Muricauda sp. AC10]